MISLSTNRSSCRQVPVSATCEFCGSKYFPRPQTKNPRSCKELKCQKKRQLKNQAEWRQSRNIYYSPEYHREKRVERSKKLGRLAESVSELMVVGARFLGVEVEEDKIRDFLTLYFLDSGITLIKKLWPPSSLWKH